MTSQQERDLRAQARAMDAQELANNLDVEATILRRWINGGIDSGMARLVQELWAKSQ